MGNSAQARISPTQNSAEQNKKDKVKEKRQQCTLEIATLNVNNIESPYFCFREDKEIQMEIRDIDQKISQLRQNKYRFMTPSINNPQIMYFNKRIGRRYSPLYKKYVGSNEQNIQFFNREQFEAEWLKQVERNSQYIDQFFKEIEGAQKIKEETLSELKIYDFMCYHAILSYLFGKEEKGIKDENFTRLINQEQENAFLKFQSFQESLFNCPTMSNEWRAIRLAKYMEEKQLKIVFLQEAELQLVSYLEKYTNKYRFSYYSEQKKPDLTATLKRNSSVKTTCMSGTGKQKFMPTQSLYRGDDNEDRPQNKICVICIWTGLVQIFLPKSCRYIPLQSHNYRRIFTQVQQDYTIQKKIPMFDEEIDHQQTQIDEVIKTVFFQLYEKNRFLRKEVQNLKIFEHIQFFGPLILISSKKDTLSKHIDRELKEMHQILSELQNKFSASIILFGLSIEIATSPKFVNPNYLASIFKNFYVYPQVTGQFLTQQREIFYPEQNYSRNRLQTIKNWYPHCHYKNRSGNHASHDNIIKSTEDFLLISRNSKHKMKILSTQINSFDEDFEKDSQVYIPNQKHPFSHFIVQAKINFVTHSFSQNQNNKFHF